MHQQSLVCHPAYGFPNRRNSYQQLGKYEGMEQNHQIDHPLVLKPKGWRLIVQKSTNNSSIQYRLTMKQEHNRSLRSTGRLVLDGDDRRCIYDGAMHESMHHYSYSSHRADRYEIIRYYARSGTGSRKRYVPLSIPHEHG